jgi:hypothetical protein
MYIYNAIPLIFDSPRNLGLVRDETTRYDSDQGMGVFDIADGIISKRSIRIIHPTTSN